MLMTVVYPRVSLTKSFCNVVSVFSQSVKAIMNIVEYVSVNELHLVIVKCNFKYWVYIFIGYYCLH